MPFTVQNLIDGRQPPTVARIDQPLHDVLTMMLEHDYSQLPVVDTSNHPIAMITSDSVIRALNTLRVRVGDLRVADVMTKKPPVYRLDDEIFDLLGSLREQPAVVVINGTHELVGIVTSWDTMEYFRQRAQDMMYVQEIEFTLKRYVTAAFRLPSGALDEPRLLDAIDSITHSNNHLRGAFQKALREYFRLCGDTTSIINANLAQTAFDTHLYHKETPKDWEELSMGEYRQLFVHKDRWDSYSSVFNIDKMALEEMLKSVGKTRNDLAHFRTEITAQQRDELRFCKEWLLRHEEAVLAVFGQDIAETPPPPQYTNEDQTAAPPIRSSILVEEASLGDSRFAPLTRYLESLQQDYIQMTFQDIERTIGDNLPNSARQWRSWWANDATSHSHAQEWLNAGWRVARITMTDEQVTFARIEGRQQAYITFYSQLLADLKSQTTLPLGNPKLDGANWMNITPLVYGTVWIGGFNFAFARTRQFRVELYIDTGNQTKNKQFFDALYAHRDQIEYDLGFTLAWQRLNTKRASRVSVHHNVFITASEVELVVLRAWAVATIVQFYTVITRYTQALQPLSD